MASDGDPAQPAEEAKPGSIFDFFGLPRELRDEIYSYLVEDVEIENGFDRYGEPEGMTKIYANEVLLNPLLLSRQIKDEYGDKVQGRQILVIRDVGDSIDYKGIPTCIRQQASRATIQMLLLHSEGDSDVADNWITDVEEHARCMKSGIELLPALKHVHVALHPCTDGAPGPEDHRSQLMEAIKEIQNMQFVSKIELYPLFQHKNEVKAFCVYKENRAPVQTWTKAKGWVDN